MENRSELARCHANAFPSSKPSKGSPAVRKWVVIFQQDFIIRGKMIVVIEYILRGKELALLTICVGVFFYSIQPLCSFLDATEVEGEDETAERGHCSHFL